MLRIVPSRMANEINIFFHQPLSKSGTAPVPAMLYTGSAMKHELKPVPFHFLFLHREKVRKREGMRNRDRRGEERRGERERERERGHRWIISRSEVHRQEPPCWLPSIALHTNDELRISIVREKGIKRATSIECE